MLEDDDALVVVLTATRVSDSTGVVPPDDTRDEPDDDRLPRFLLDVLGEKMRFSEGNMFTCVCVVDTMSLSLSFSSLLKCDKITGYHHKEIR